MGAKVKNPRKKFLWSISFPKHPINTYLFQTCQLPDIEIDQVAQNVLDHIKKAKHRAGSPLSYPLFCRSIRLQPRLLPFRVYLKSQKFSLFLQTQPDFALKSLKSCLCLRNIRHFLCFQIHFSITQFARHANAAGQKTVPIVEKYPI